MAKNLMQEIIKILGVEYGEAFKIRRPGYEVCENGVYAFFEGEGLMKRNEQGEFDNNSSIEFEDLCLDNYEVVKLPWEPKNGEKYWSIHFTGIDKPYTDAHTWTGHDLDFVFLRLGVVYRTKEEAEAHLAEDYERLTGRKLEG